jgi:hypothetical protein
MTQVLPPSALYCQSYDARCPADAAMTSATPVLGPGFAVKTRGLRVARHPRHEVRGLRDERGHGLL